MEKDTRTDIITPIRLIDAAHKYEVDYQTLLDWGRAGIIIVTKRAGVTLADENSIKSYLTLQEQIKKHDEYLAKTLEEKKEEVYYTIAAYDDYLFSMRTLEKTVKIFPVIIRELSLIIKNEKTRDIFVNVALGKDIYMIAKKHSITYDRACSIYEHGINLVTMRGRLFEKYRNRIIELARKNRRLELLINNLKEHIARLEELKGISVEISDVSGASDNILYLLSLTIEKDLGLDTRCKKALARAKMNTVEDILRYVSNHDGKLDSLLEFNKFGLICLQNLKRALLRKHIIDEDGYSYLMDYLM